MTAFDISLKFVRAAHKMSVAEDYSIEHCLANAVQIPFTDNVFDFVIATMSIMDMPEQERVLAEVYRVLRPGGFFQFSICHPCFMTRHRKPLRDENGDEYAVEIGGYFNPLRGEVESWFFSNAPQELKDKFAPLQTPRFDNTLSGWLNILLDVGFRMERFVEPSADDETIKRCPHVADTRVVGYFLIILCRKAE